MKETDLRALYARLGRPVPAEIAVPDVKAKYGANKTTLDGITFDSAGEARAYWLLRSWEASGAIRDLELQPEFVLQAALRNEHGKHVRAIVYRADFKFWDVDRAKVRVVDFKGFRTPVFLLKMKLMAEKFPQVQVELWDRAKLRELGG